MTRGRMRFLQAGVALFLAIQIAVPIAALAGPRPTRFSWQMFTTFTPAPAAWIEDADGAVEAVDLAALLVHPRPESDLAGAIVSALCAEEGRVAVIIEQHGRRSRTPCG